MVRDKEFELMTTKNQKLEQLCRALQEERKNLSQKLQAGAAEGQTPSVATAETPSNRTVEKADVSDENKPAETSEEKPKEIETPTPVEAVTPPQPKEIETPTPAEPATTVQPPQAAAATPESPLTKELSSLKAQQARLKEIAASFTVSHVVPQDILLAAGQSDSEGDEATGAQQEPAGASAIASPEQTQSPALQKEPESLLDPVEELNSAESVQVNGCHGETLVPEEQEERDKEMETVD